MLLLIALKRVELVSTYNVKTNKYRFSSLILITATLLSYQNCSQPFSSKNQALLAELNISSSLPEEAPSLIIQSSPSSISNSTNVNITYQAQAKNGAQIVSIQCALNAMQPVDCMQGFNRSGLGNGNYVLKIIAKDSRGLSSREEMVTWIVDTLAPTANFLMAPADNGIVSSSSVNITFSQPSDVNGISSISCSYGNSLATIASNPINCANNSLTLSNLSAGAVYVRVKITDMAQNVFNLDKNFSVQFNLPIVTLLNPKPNAYSNITSFTFTYSGSLNGQALTTFECALDAQAYAACNGGSKAYTQTNLTEGSHTFKVRSVDASTNTKSGEQTYQFTIDRTNPVVTITAPTAGATLTTNSVNATFTVTDANLSTVTRICRLDNVQLATCNNSVALNNLSNGPHTFSVTATDEATNQTVVTRNFTVNVSMTVNRVLSWDPSVDANNSVDFSVTSYNIYVGTAPGVYNAPISAAAGSLPSQTLANLVVGQTYYFAVSAVNAAGESPKSTVLTYVAQ